MIIITFEIKRSLYSRPLPSEKIEEGEGGGGGCTQAYKTKI